MIRPFTLSTFKKLIGDAIKKVANPPVGGLATFEFEYDSLFQFHIRYDRFNLFIQFFIHRVKFSGAV